MSLKDFPHKDALYKHLLIRYFQIIQGMEGHDFLEDENPNTDCNDEEYEELKRISAHADRNVYECSRCGDNVDCDTEEHIPKEDWPGPWKTIARVCKLCKGLE
jgi:hypothetical protein